MKNSTLCYFSVCLALLLSSQYSTTANARRLYQDVEEKLAGPALVTDFGWKDKKKKKDCHATLEVLGGEGGSHSYTAKKKGICGELEKAYTGRDKINFMVDEADESLLTKVQAAKKEGAPDDNR